MEHQDEYELSPRITLSQGSPVRVAGRRGLFRFIRQERKHETEEWYAVLIGPIGGAEIERLVPVDDLRSAGQTPRTAVAMSPEMRDLNARAQNVRRKA